MSRRLHSGYMSSCAQKAKSHRKGGFQSQVLDAQGLNSGGASGIRTPDLRIMIPLHQASITLFVLQYQQVRCDIPQSFRAININAVDSPLTVESKVQDGLIVYRGMLPNRPL